MKSVVLMPSQEGKRYFLIGFIDNFTSLIIGIEYGGKLQSIKIFKIDQKAPENPLLSKELIEI
jgi:hypothetical protein